MTQRKQGVGVPLREAAGLPHSGAAKPLLPKRACSEVESIAHLSVNLPRIHVVCASKGVAVIEHVTLVTNIGGVKGNRPTLPKVLAYGKVNRRVRRQMGRAIAVQEARPEVNYRGRPDAAR